MPPISDKTRIRIAEENQSWLDYHGSAAVEKVVADYPRVCPEFIRKHATTMRGVHDFAAEIERFNRFDWCLKHPDYETPIASHPMFKIETHSKYLGWTDDPSFLGHGATDEDNRWPTEGDAESACYELAAAGVVSPECLRVVPAL